jgi:peptidoglycan-associated lipoprotein
MIRSFPSGVAALVAIALVAGACGPKKVDTKPPAPAPAETAKPAPAPPPPAPPPPAPPPPTPTISEDELIGRMTPNELTEKGYLKPVFFAYDSIELSDEARGTLQKNVEFLKKWSAMKVMVEGHADSRGTNEYNLALAERRSAVVRDYVMGLSVAKERITTVSKGEEQPFCREESEACWQQNRRGHFIFTAGAK